jgi:hypothetical protein
MPSNKAMRARDDMRTPLPSGPSVAAVMVNFLIGLHKSVPTK